MGLKGSVGGVENPESPDGAVGRAAMEGQERTGVENPESLDGAADFLIWLRRYAKMGFWGACCVKKMLFRG